METNTDVSPQFKSTSISVLSPTGSHIAHLTNTRLQVRCLTTFEIIRNIGLPTSHNFRNSKIAWSHPSPVTLSQSTPSPNTTPPRSRRSPPPPRSHRFLVCDDDSTRVFDLRDDKWNAVISNGSGGMGKNMHVEFGRDEEEVFVWSGFNSKVTIWCLRTGRTVEVRDPKFVGRGWGFRFSGEDEEEGDGKRGERGGLLALLCRSAGQDILMLLAPRTYAVVKRVELPTVDAQGLRWSRDGRWIAVWEAAAHGYTLCIFTADAHLYRTIIREPSDDLNEWGVEGLGIKSVEWVPGNEYLAVGGWDRRVRILSARTFSPVVFLDHTSEIFLPTAPVYTETVGGQGQREYTVTTQPAIPPTAVLEKSETGLMKRGISIMAFSKTGTLCATKDDLTPTTVWIWDLRSLKPRMILIQHAPVKSLQWHPKDPFRLLIQTTQDAPVVYLYTSPAPTPALTTSTSKTSISNSTSTRTRNPSYTTSTSSPPPAPTILNLADSLKKPPASSSSSLPSAKPSYTARFLPTPPTKKPLILLASQHSYILIWPEGKDQILRFENSDGDDDDSDDSLYNILTGRTPIPPLHGASRDSLGSVALNEEGDSLGSLGRESEGFVDSTMGGEAWDDTFRDRGWTGVGGVRGRQRGRSVLDESGLDEMF